MNKKHPPGALTLGGQRASALDTEAPRKQRAARLVTTLIALTHINITTKGLLMQKFNNDATTMGAVIRAQGALAMCIARVLTPEQRADLATGLAAIATQAEKAGDTTLETLLIDMHQAIR